MLHLFGIPGTILGVLLMPIYVLLMSIPLFLLALVLFLGGFGLQFLGHALDGTEPGEIKALRTWVARRREARARAGADPGGLSRGRGAAEPLPIGKAEPSGVPLQRPPALARAAVRHRALALA